MVRVEVKDKPEIWCETVIEPADIIYRMTSSMKKIIDQLGVWWEHQMEKTPHHKLKKIQTLSEYRKLIYKK